MTRPTRPPPARLPLGLWLAQAAMLAACAGAPPAPPQRPEAAAPSPAAGQTAQAAAVSEAAAARGQRLFDEAVRAREEMDKAKSVDWPVLEARWRAAAEAGDLPEARYNLGVTLERQGRFAEARAEYQRAIARKPLRQAAVNLAVLLEREGDVRGAAAAYAAVVRDFPEDGVARARLGAIYRQSGQLDEAWRLSREALLREPGSVVAYRTMVRVALARNDVDLARLVALRAQKVAPDDAEVAFLGGQIAAKQGDAAGAATQWRRALELQPGFLPARTGLLDAAVRQARWAEVAEQAAAILKDDPASAPVQLVLGVAQRHLGKADDALRSYTSAEQLGAGRLPEVHMARAILLMRDKGDCPGALKAFDAYQRAVGPMLPQGSPAPRLMRECQEQLEQNRQAAEAARQLQLEAEKKAAEAAARKAVDASANQPPAGTPPPDAPAEGGAPVSPPPKPAGAPKKP